MNDFLSEPILFSMSKFGGKIYSRLYGAKYIPTIIDTKASSDLKCKIRKLSGSNIVSR